MNRLAALLDGQRLATQPVAAMDSEERNPTTRFSDRVANYIRFRPGYPEEVIHTLQSRCGLTKESRVADVGSGTGISTKLFLDHGNRVFAIEPNREMREAAEQWLGGDPDFTSLSGTAEATGLPAAAVDFVVAGQAFHWFDQLRAKAEFMRILRPGGWVVLVWNDRKTGTTPFLRDYESFLLRHSTDYRLVNHTNINEEILGEFYAPGSFQLLGFKNFQEFDFEGLKGRCLSSSYIPNEGHPGYETMLSELRDLFDAREEAGSVRFEYQTKIYFGRLGGQPGA